METRFAKSHGKRHRTIELVVIVARLPEFASRQTRINKDRRIVNDGARIEAFVESRRINEGLKGRTGLTQRLRDMIEHVEVEVEASHQTLDGACVEVHADETCLHFGDLR